MCECRKQVNKELCAKLGVNGEIINYEMLSGRIYSTFEYMDGKRKKTIPVLHSFCPICGQKYEEK